jgi:hypothetical protein
MASQEALLRRGSAVSRFEFRVYALPFLAKINELLTAIAALR